MRIGNVGASCLIVLACFAGLAGCADPAKGKPKAVVEEAAPVTPVAPSGERYVLADGSAIRFVGAKVTGSHDGGFKAFTGEIMLVGGDPTASSVSIVIDATSLWTDNERLTGHLKTADFFDVETYPTARFESTAIQATPDGFSITGNLDLHGVVKSITFPATISVAADQVVTQAEFSVRRFDFGIAYAGKADDLIRDEVVIRFDLIAVPAGAV